MGWGHGEGIAARQLASARGVPPFELEAERFVCVLQLTDGLVRFTLNVVSDIVCADDLVISRAEVATSIFKVHMDSVKLVMQGHGGVLLQVILSPEIVMLPLQ